MPYKFINNSGALFTECIEVRELYKIYEKELSHNYDGYVSLYKTLGDLGLASVPMRRFVLWIYENQLVYKNFDEIIVLWKLENG